MCYREILLLNFILLTFPEALVLNYFGKKLLGKTKIIVHYKSFDLPSIFWVCLFCKKEYIYYENKEKGKLIESSFQAMVNPRESLIWSIKVWKKYIYKQTSKEAKPNLERVLNFFTTRDTWSANVEELWFKNLAKPQLLAFLARWSNNRICRKVGFWNASF